MVDVTEVPFINSTAFGALVKARGQLHAAGGELALSGLSGKPREVFEVLQLGAMIQRYDTVEEGVSGLRWVDAGPAAVPDSLDVRISFRFRGHDQIIVAGTAWHDAALQTISERELQFLWYAPQGMDLFTVFAPGARLEVRPGLTPEDPSVQADVLNMVPAPEGAALVQVEYQEPPDGLRAAIREFVRRAAGG